MEKQGSQVQVPENALDMHQTVELILQFLKENNLSESFKTLANESGMTFNQLQNKEEFIQNIRKGFWHVVLKQITFLTLKKTTLLSLYSLVIKELLLQKEVDIAQYLIKEQTYTLLQEFPEDLQKLWDLSYVKEPPHTVQSLFGKDIRELEQVREQVIKTILSELENQSTQSNRLLQLLSQGMLYEKIKDQPKASWAMPSQGIKLEKEGEVKIPTATKIQCHKKFSGEFKVQTITVSHDGKYLVIGGRDGLIEVWNYLKMELDQDLPYQAKELFMLHRKAVLSLTYSLDDKILASGDQEGIIKIWKFSDGKKLREIDTQGGERSGIASLAFTSNNSQIVVGCLDQSMKLYGLKSGNLMRDIKGISSFVLQTILIPQKENLVLSSSEDSQVTLWNLSEQDPKTQKVLRVVTPDQRLGKELIMNNIQLHPQDPNLLLVCQRYKSAYLLDYQQGLVLQEYSSSQAKEEEMLFAQFSGDGNHVYAFSTNKNMYIFETRTGKLEALVLIPVDKIEIAGINVSGNQKAREYESLILYSSEELFKLDSNL